LVGISPLVIFEAEVSIYSTPSKPFVHILEILLL